MVRNLSRGNDVVELYCNHIILFYRSLMLVLLLYYDYLLFIAYI